MNRPPRILILAGEESGVLYADGIVAAVRAKVPGAEIRGYGDYGFRTADLAVFGIFAVLKRIFYFLRVKRTMERAIDEWKPDAVCTIDYPGMNLKLAAYAKKRGVKAVHVVCPQVWAWKRGRIPKIEASLDKLCCFFPFEPRLFRTGFAEFVGHPLVEEFKKDSKRTATSKLIGVLPGSRIGEIERHLPILLEAVRKVAAEVDGVRVVIPAANGKAKAAIERILAGLDCKTEIAGETAIYEVTLGGARALLQRAECAVVASGTATLEAALARCPTVLVYRVDRLLAWFLRHAIKGVKHVGLANIIVEKSGTAKLPYPMPELLQDDFTAENVSNYLLEWLKNDKKRQESVKALDDAMALLKSDGNALTRITDFLI